ncbi:MAG TPA: hypothetical protein VNZ49_06550 [Bacteroidia bacterium]|jgi:hypothetical protein|nr:hypothetical protein [Bacteroidia bacterium]
MKLRLKNTFFVFIFCISFSFFAQDTVRYRTTSFHLSGSHFVLLGPEFQQTNNFFPSAAFSLKSFRADSLYKAKENFHFILTMGAAGSRFMLTDPSFFVNVPDNRPLPVFSKRFWGGFGLNYRKAVSKKIVLDIDMAPCIQIIVDKSEETRTDTAGWESKGFTDIYQGLLLYANVKAEFFTFKNFAVYASISGSVPMINRFGNHGDDPYHDKFKGQIFIGFGLAYFYKTRHIIEPDEKTKTKQ